jgi:hypothetical protein
MHNNNRRRGEGGGERGVLSPSFGITKGLPASFHIYVENKILLNARSLEISSFIVLH